MEKNKILTLEDIVSDLAGLSLLRDEKEVASCALKLLEDYRRIALLGQRFLLLPKKWTQVYEEVLLLFEHHIKNLGDQRPGALLILEASGKKPSNPGLPVYPRNDLLLKMNVHCEFLETVRNLPENERSLLPLHLAEIISASERITRLEAWLQEQINRAVYMTAFLWELASTLNHNLLHPHIWDKDHNEPGVLTILSSLFSDDK